MWNNSGKQCRPIPPECYTPVQMRLPCLRIVLFNVLCCCGLFACKESSDERRAAEGEQLSIGAAAPSSAGPQCLAVDTGHTEVWLEPATVVVGTDQGYPEEAPATTVDVAGFWIDVHEVTNAQFAEFVKQTGYVTTAERTPDPKQYPNIPADLLKPGSAVFTRPATSNPQHWTDWWRFAEGASWHTPQGPGTNIDGLDSHPVIHISYLDASAYARWRGRSLPTEAQWERAAQGQPALNKHEANKQARRANTWQGFFPLQNTTVDGFQGSAPVGCYPASEHGLHDLIGNVWEWVSDVYEDGHSAARLNQVPEASQPSQHNVAGADVRVVKGGSFLCAANYCQRDRPQGRQPQEADFGSIHIGFRTVRNVPLESAQDN